MVENHKLGLYVSYYLSRFNDVAYKNLGYGNMLETHKKIGQIISVPANTVKNWRDEFDPIFGHRVGWYQRPMIQSRIRVVEALKDLDEISLQAIVLDILKGDTLNNSFETEQLVSIISDKELSFESGKFILRGPTGKIAEDFFIQQFNNNKIPFTGKLIDCREYGCGYDFMVEGLKTLYIEVKGLAGSTGGILFTNKEWQLANDKKDLYYLCVIKNIESQPTIQFINNPAERLNPNKYIHTVIQVSWSVSEKELNL
jgi:hypothetical protein